MGSSLSRREFIKRLAAGSGAVVFGSGILFDPLRSIRGNNSLIYVSENGTVYQNVDKVIELMGGIENFIGKDDIVVIKPNCQWWNQGTTNVSAIRRFIELVLNINGFRGEIIVAENNQRSNYNSRGWTVENEINYDPDARNLNELISLFNGLGYENVTKYHLLSSDKGGRVVSGPEEGDGYVHTNIEYSFEDRATIMTYPIFTSSYSGITIDFKNGAWKDGDYIDKKIKFINFSVLNHHYLGATCAVKNHLGVVDLPGDDEGRNEFGQFPDGHYNFHSILTRGMGGAIGKFFNTIRFPDLNIIAAEWVGWGSRIDPEMAIRAKRILASTDPVALDFWATKYILYPLTPEDFEDKEYHHPENDYGHLWKYLYMCNSQGIGTMKEEEMTVYKFDFGSGINNNYTVRSGCISVAQNYPNPFQSSTVVSYELTKGKIVYICIFDSVGRVVRRLVNGRYMASGPHATLWNGTDDNGNHLPAGIYILKIIAGGDSCSIKLLLY